ncbi:hypothetical protein ACFX13_004630 [Malus domestica]
MTTEEPNRVVLNPDLNRGIGGESRTLDRRTIQIGRIVPPIVAAILRWVASAIDAIDFDPLARHRAVFNGIWRLLRGVVRLYRYGCTTIVSLIPNTISLLCQSLSAGSLSAGFLFTIVVAVATLIGHLGSQLAFPAPTRSISASRATGPFERMFRSPRSAYGSTLQSVLRFLQNVPSRWRIAGAVVVVGAARAALRNLVHTT